MTALPERFVGVWTRVSLALGGGAPFERQLVVWAQASSGYADIRTPLGPDDADPVAAPVSFAGTCAWDGTSLHWTRTIDLDPGAGTVLRTAAGDVDVFFTRLAYN